MDTDNIQPGHALDALVAEKVMGCKVNRLEHHGRLRFECGCDEIDFRRPHGSWSYYGEPDEELAAYSQCIESAWEIVEKLGLFIGPFLNNEWWAFESIDDYMNSRVSKGETAPMAICRAALKAVGA